MAGFRRGPGPAYTEDVDFDGQLEDGQRRCECNLLPARRVCFEGTHVGRRFYGCCVDRCAYADWVDGPWPPVLQRCLTKLWSEAQAVDLALDFNRERISVAVEDATEELTAQMEEMESAHYDDICALRDKYDYKILKAKHAYKILEAKYAAATSGSNTGKDPRPASGSSSASGHKTLPAHTQECLQLVEEIRKKQKCSRNPVKRTEAKVGPNARSKNSGTRGRVANALEKKFSAELASSSTNSAPTSTTDPMFHSEAMEGIGGGTRVMSLDALLKLLHDNEDEKDGFAVLERHEKKLRKTER